MMGLSFLTPTFFLGVLALAVPVIIHMSHREKREIIAFPSLMFVRKIPYRSVRRQRIRHWLLFCLRCLALLLLVLAFARPFFERTGSAATNVLGARELVILLDRSYSMGYGSRWERALDAARQAIDGIGIQDHATLIAFSDRAELLNSPTSNKDELRALLGTLDLSSRTTRFGPALQLAKKQLEESALPRKEVVLITDFQKVGWDGEENDAWLPRGTVVTPVDLSDESTSNVSVASVVLDRELVSGRERVVISARLTNKGDTPFEGHQVSLELNERVIQDKRVSLEENNSVMVRFEPFSLPEGISRGRVRVADDSLPQDNVFHFVIWPGQAIPILVLDGPGEGSRRNLYLRQALAIGERPSFRVQTKRLDQLGRQDLNSVSVVLINDAAPPRAGASGLLRRFVEDGGGLVLVSGENSAGRPWTEDMKALVPAPWEETIDRMADWGGTLSFVDYSHPVFELFSAPHSGDFSTARFFRYRELAEPVEEGVLARFDDGTVALAEMRVGEGRVLMWSSSLDTFWNDLALQPVFLPFVHRLVRYAGGYAEASAWETVGGVLDLARFIELATASPVTEGSSEVLSAERLVAIAPSGERSLLSDDEGRSILELSEQGFYELRQVGVQTARPLSVAANPDLRESDLSAIDPEEFVATISFREGDETLAAGTELTPADHEKRQRFWWYLLIAALALLVVETVFSNRLSGLAR